MSENLLSIIPSLQVTSEDVREGELLAQQYLGALYPEIDFRPGLAVYDQVIRPTGTMIAVVNKGVELLFQNNTVEDITDSTPTEFVDKLMSNHFMVRRSGANSTILARFYFLRQKDVYIAPSYFFSTNNTELFYPVEDRLYAASELQVSYEEEALAPYFLDVELTSGGTGEQYNIESGSLLYFTVFDPFFVGGDIRYLKSKAISEETNTEFLARVEPSLSTRNLINDPSIRDRMLTVFNYINLVETVGFGDAEMLRDKAIVPSMTTPGATNTIHMGGRVDVYVDSDIEVVPLVEVTIAKKSDSDHTLGFHLSGPVVGFAVAPTPADKVGVEPYKNVGLVYQQGITMIRDDYSNDTGFSQRQQTFVRLQQGTEIPFTTPGPGGTTENFEEGDKFFVNVTQFSNMASIQSYLDDRVTRVVCADYLARALEPCQLTVKIDILERSSTDTEEEYEALAADVITSYLDSLGNGGTFSMAEFISALQVGGISGMSIPIDVSYVHLHRDDVDPLTGPTKGTIEDTFTLDRLSRFTLSSVAVTFVDDEV